MGQIRRYTILLLLLIIGCNTLIYCQEDDFGTGLLPDDGTYNTLPQKASLTTRDYSGLPSKWSLKSYTPYARSQSHYGTCASWATVYGARTIAEAIANNWTDRQTISSEAFSPIYIYAQIKDQSDYECKRGSHIFDALGVMKSRGVVKMADFDELCSSMTPEHLKEEASRYKIEDYFTLFKLNNIGEAEKVIRVKKAVSENCPVVIAMRLPKSFHQAQSDWSGIDVDPGNHGYHAMCVVGYDDNHNGGSFEIMNSWGLRWGNEGFTWVKYSDFGRYVDQAYELYLGKGKNIIDSQKPNKFSGEITMKLSTGEEMEAGYRQATNTYRLKESYLSGTRYRVFISNDEPAYVYVVGSDLENNVSVVFPPDPSISAALTYRSNNIALPDEKYFIEMDGVRGTDYMCVLYSSEPLDIESVAATIKRSSGTFEKKVSIALAGQAAKSEDTVYKPSLISFNSQTSGTVVPIIIEIPHR